MQRYFLSNTQIQNNKAVIIDSDHHHIRNVMRFEHGDTIIVCNQDGVCWYATIDQINDTIIEVSLQKKTMQTELPVHVDIAQGLIRRERFEMMIQKSMELGARTIYPLLTKRTIVKTNTHKIERKIQRWNTIAKEACEQAHRNVQGSVVKPISIQDVPFHQYDVVLVAYEEESESMRLPQVLTRTFQTILVIIGPEGGFDSSEIEYLKTISNVEIVGFGKRILRSETASSFILSVIGYQYEMVIQ